MKKCSSCGEEKGDDEFYESSGNICKVCKRITALAWYHSNLERANDTKLRRIYGLTSACLQRMLEEQNNMCAICGTHVTRGHVDHCHSTGKVRGILCNHCNIGLGHFKDSPAALQAAIQYLTK